LPGIGDGEGTAIPDPRVKRSVGNAAEFAFEAEGNRYRAGELVRTRGPVGVESRVGIVELEFPGPIEILPKFPLKLRLGELGPGHGGPKGDGRKAGENEARLHT